MAYYQPGLPKGERAEGALGVLILPPWVEFLVYQLTIA